MNKKNIIEIGLRDITKADLEIKSASTPEIANHIIGGPNYELIKSTLITRVLGFSMQEVDIPFAGPKNSLFESLTSRRFATPEKVAETLKDLVSQLTRLYHVSITERKQYVEVALERIAREYSLDVEETKTLTEDIDFILNDGIKKTFRDNIGRQIPVPEASSMASLVGIMIAKIIDTLNAGKSLISTFALTELIRDYAVVERRAALATSEFDKRQTFDELTALTKKISVDPLLCLLVKNRLEYTINASSPTIRMSVIKFAELINTSVVELRAIDITSSVKIMEFSTPILDSAERLDDIERVTLRGTLDYIDEVMGAVSMQRSTSDMVNTIFSIRSEGEPAVKSTRQEDTDSKETIRSLHMLYFKLELMKMIAQSFTTIPPFESNSLSVVTQSLNAKLDVYTIEPFIIALDNVKLAYVSSLKEALTTVKKGWSVPTIYEIEDAQKRIEIPPVFKMMLMKTHDAEYKTFMTAAIAAVANRAEQVTGMKELASTSWRLGRLLKRPAKGVNYVGRSGILYDMESHLEETVDVISNDGSMSSEEMISILAGSSGEFKTIPYQVFKYSFGSPDLDSYFSHVSLDTYMATKEVSLANGVATEAHGDVVLLDSLKSETNDLIRQKLNISTEKFWCVKMPLLAVFLPKVKYKLCYHDPFTDSFTSVMVNSPLLQMFVTAMKSGEIKRVLSTYVNNNTLYSVMGGTWPAISTRVTAIGDVERHKILASLLPAETESRKKAEGFSSTGAPTLSKAADINPKEETTLIDFTKLSDNGLGNKASEPAPIADAPKE